MAAIRVRQVSPRWVNAARAILMRLYLLATELASSPTQLDLPVSTPDWERKTALRFAIHSFWRNIIFHFIRHHGRKILILWEYSHVNLTDFPTLSNTATLYIQWLTQVQGSCYKCPTCIRCSQTSELLQSHHQLCQRKNYQYSKYHQQQCI